ncbi:hypothetical protein BXZ70DRAFT_945429 [Cristinia sonorae]|uniref:F-box domain-containing protein n=1 Tax=Cristinia sonorae TaxID=1940300 RepID=A0A8K0UKX6_9AGAR|nr:hypothetical protein BXZ70DRAFT_945429 [Cristinia sonorae]
MAAPPMLHPRRTSYSMPNISLNPRLSTPGLIPTTFPRIATCIKPQASFTIYIGAKGPIGRIPNEILAQIFCALYQEVDDHWVRILQVCKLWNAVARRIASLWTRVSADQPFSSLDKFLMQSSDRPLRVFIRRRRRLDVATFVNALGSHICRVESLSATLLWCADFHKIVSPNTFPWSSLRDLELRITHPRHHSNNPHTFSLNDLRMVRSIRLTNIGISHTGGFLPCLTQLELESGQGLPPLSQLLAILRAAPTLKVLEISGPCHDLFVDMAANVFPIHLSHLARLVIRSDPEFPREFFSLVSTPPSADVTICLPVITLRGVPPRFLCDSLPARGKLPHIGGIKDINGLSLRFHGIAPSLMGFRVGEGCKPLFSIIIVDTTYPPSKTPYQGVVDGVTQAIHFLDVGQRVVSAELTGTEDGEEDHTRLDITDIFRTLPNLQALSIRKSGMADVLSALSSLTVSGSGGVAQAVVCPHLTDVQLQDIEFNDDLIVNMLDCFERRRELGAIGLKYLLLSGTKGLEAGDVVMLEGMAERVKFC